jgi:hypothetical protein
MISLAGCSFRYMMRNCLWKRLCPPYANTRDWIAVAPSNCRSRLCVRHLDGNCKEARADAGGCGSRNASPHAEVMAGRKFAPRRRADDAGRSRTDHSRTLTTIPAELGQPRAGYALGVHYDVLPQFVGPKLSIAVGKRTSHRVVRKSRVRLIPSRLSAANLHRQFACLQ